MSKKGKTEQQLPDKEKHQKLYAVVKKSGRSSWSLVKGI